MESHLDVESVERPRKSSETNLEILNVVDAVAVDTKDSSILADSNNQVNFIFFKDLY